jgi:hypothetical protein
MPSGVTISGDNPGIVIRPSTRVMRRWLKARPVPEFKVSYSRPLGQLLCSGNAWVTAVPGTSRHSGVNHDRRGRWHSDGLYFLTRITQLFKGAVSEAWAAVQAMPLTNGPPSHLQSFLNRSFSSRVGRGVRDQDDRTIAAMKALGAVPVNGFPVMRPPALRATAQTGPTGTVTRDVPDERSCSLFSIRCSSRTTV